MKQVLLCILLLTSLVASAQKNKKQKWVQLFNGKDLTDWRIKIRGYPLNENFGNTFRVEDGKIKVSYDGYGDDFKERFGHIFYKVPFSYYLIAVEYRFVGEQAPKGPDWAWRNSGIMLHCQSPESMGLNQDFPISIEVQLLGGPAEGKRTTCNLCTPGTNVVMDGKLVTAHCINSTSETYRGDQWVRAEVLVLGDSVIKHIINKDTVLTYNKPQIGGGNVLDFDPMVKADGQLLSTGYISLQSESHPVEFRKVEILNLEDKYKGKNKDRNSSKRPIK
jgi:3-keto-disaccharide hydrolase